MDRTIDEDAIASVHAGGEATPSRDGHALGGIVIAVALLTCLFIIALPALGSLALAAVVLAVFAGTGLAAIFALSRF